MSQFYPVWVDTQRFVVPAASVGGIERVRDYGSPTTALHTRWGRIPLYDLTPWVTAIRRELMFRYAVLVVVNTLRVGVIIDRVDDLITVPEPVFSLPSLVRDALIDSTVSGVIMLDELPCLVLDLTAFILAHSQ